MTLVQSEPKAIKIGMPKSDYSAMQGPCPDGFHVPLNTEWQSVYDIWTALGGGSSDGTNFGIALKLPFAGYRTYSTANVGSQGSVGLYWSSTHSNENSAYRLNFNSSSITPQSNGYRSYASSVRSFKNTPVTPTSSWTKLYGTSIEDGGIFWSSTDGLISLSSDGSNWITIADKNLGATAVWNSGDTLSQSNCGYYYQRGNNYGFPWTGSVTTSSTRIDASNYGPGNYYSSSTFITRSSIPYRWDSTDNGNLRGGETGAVLSADTDIKAVYIGSTKVRPPYKPRTFTITRTEKSDMSSGWTYSDDAAGLTAGDTAFDEFFGYYGCRLNTSGVETDTITQEESGGAGKLDITQLGTLTSGDNVMIAFPVRGIKMTKSGSTVTLSITDGLGRERDGYQYYAFQNTGDIEANASTTVATKPLYIGTYLNYTNGTALKSWSGKVPTGSCKMGDAITYAGNNGTGWTIMGFYQRMLINAYYMMKYGNPNSQSVVGMGYVYGNSGKANTGGTNSQTNATYGSSSTSTQCKLFGLEDWWGNQTQMIGGAFTDSSANIYTALHDFTANMSTSDSQYKNAGTLSSGGTAYDCLSYILGTNKGMFGPTNTTNNSSFNTYYCDYIHTGGPNFISVGGNYAKNYECGAFQLSTNLSVSSSNAWTGTRLMYLNGLT